jgi:2',3'-cyclic-nucleotide 2'-phosphodiesterase
MNDLYCNKYNDLYCNEYKDIYHIRIIVILIALGHFLDGRVSTVFGTHTHVQTADERILQGGTAFITDIGMCGTLNGMLGLKKEPIIQHFINQMPTKFEVDDSSPLILSGILVDIDIQTGKAIFIERINLLDSDNDY